MSDITIGDLMNTITDALTLPQAASVTDRMRRSAILRERSEGVRKAASYASSTGDLETAATMLDQAMNQHPIDYQVSGFASSEEGLGSLNPSPQP